MKIPLLQRLHGQVPTGTIAFPICNFYEVWLIPSSVIWKLSSWRNASPRYMKYFVYGCVCFTSEKKRIFLKNGNMSENKTFLKADQRVQSSFMDNYALTHWTLRQHYLSHKPIFSLILKLFMWIVNGWPWWRHQMETLFALLVICAGNSPEPAQRPVTRSFDVFFDLRLNKRLSKQS